MEYNWQGSDSKKLSKLKEIYKSESDENKDFFSLAVEEKPIVHICNSIPPDDTFFWYVQNSSTDNISDLNKFYLKIKQEKNIKNILIKDASYSVIYGYVHILLDKFDKVIYLRNEHEIDSYMVYSLVEEKIDASS